MSRALTLIGGNGDTIALQDEFTVASKSVYLGTPEPEFSIRRSLAGRTVDHVEHFVTRAKFDIHILGDSVLEHRAATRRLAAALSSVDGPVWLIIDHGDNNPVALVCRSVTALEPLLRKAEATDSTVTVKLEAIDEPHYVAVEAETRSLTVGIAATNLWLGWTPSDAPIPSDSAIPSDGYFIEDAESQTIDLMNNGDVPAWPTWVIDGPATSISLASERVGKVIVFEHVIAAGDKVRIVTNPRTPRVTLNGLNAWEHTARRSEMWAVLPGENPTEISVLGGTDGVTNVGVEWNNRYSAP